ncbi:hypothetical protein [Murinocardiopsis flavida]|uniref:hypothetical protein n=1 Tax=Murinocardiopsis flavida TaxID=645275 RepID=UPI0011B22AC5|nr:hypothetical protein [Murinocardiopsis flavida]
MITNALVERVASGVRGSRFAMSPLDHGAGGVTVMGENQKVNRNIRPNQANILRTRQLVGTSKAILCSRPERGRELR